MSIALDKGNIYDTIIFGRKFSSIWIRWAAARTQHGLTV